MKELPPDYEEIIQGVDVGRVFTRLTMLISQWIKTHGAKTGEESGSSSETADMDATNQSVDLYRFEHLMTIDTFFFISNILKQNNNNFPLKSSISYVNADILCSDWSCDHHPTNQSKKSRL